MAGWSWRAGDLPDPWSQQLVTTPVAGLFMVGIQAFTRLFLGGTGTSLFSGMYAADVVLGRRPAPPPGIAALARPRQFA